MEQPHKTSAIPIVEEVARLDKEEVVTGKVTVRTVSKTVEQTVSESLLSHDVEITSVAINKDVPSPPEMRTVDGVLIVPVLEERLVVEKRLFVTEELHIRQRTTQQVVEAQIPVRKQEAVIDRADVNGTPADKRS